MNEFKPRPIQVNDTFRVTPSNIQGVRWIDSVVHADNRGYFFEGYREEIHRALSGDYAVQTNISVSKPNTLRGFHWHRYQHDFWSIASGLAQVVVVDAKGYDERVLGPGQGVIINPVVGHGFLALSDLVLIYNVTRHHDAGRPDEQGFSATYFRKWMADPPNVIRSSRDLDYDKTTPTPNFFW